MYPDDAKCIMLRRMSSPCRWDDMEIEFWLNSSALSEVLWEVIMFFHPLNAPLVTTFRLDLMKDRSATYARATDNVGAPLHT